MKKLRFDAIIVILMALVVGLTGCVTGGIQTKQYGVSGDDTIALNLTNDPNVGTVIITHVNGEATGGLYKEDPGFLGFGAKSEIVIANPCYVRLTGKPITFTVLCPVAKYYDSGEKYIVRKKTEIRLTKLADLKPGQVITLKWLYQTQTFAFVDGTGNIIEQMIPTFF